MRHLSASIPRLVDQRDEPSIYIEEASSMADVDRRDRREARCGDVASRILTSLERATTAKFDQMTRQLGTTEGPVAPGLKLTLRPFQKQTLLWMMEKEAAPPEDVVAIQTRTSAPLWHGRGTFHLWPPPRGGFLMQEMVRCLPPPIPSSQSVDRMLPLLD